MSFTAVSTLSVVMATSEVNWESIIGVRIISVQKVRKVSLWIYVLCIFDMWTIYVRKQKPYWNVWKKRFMWIVHLLSSKAMDSHTNQRWLSDTFHATNMYIFFSRRIKYSHWWTKPFSVNKTLHGHYSHVGLSSLFVDNISPSAASQFRRVSGPHSTAQTLVCDVCVIWNAGSQGCLNHLRWAWKVMYVVMGVLLRKVPGL